MIFWARFFTISAAIFEIWIQKLIYGPFGFLNSRMTFFGMTITLAVWLTHWTLVV